MRRRWKAAAVLAAAIGSCVAIHRDESGWSWGLGSDALADVTVTKARIGCVDIQRDGNLTGLVGQACNHHMSCSYKAPTEDQYKRACSGRDALVLHPGDGDHR